LLLLARALKLLALLLELFLLDLEDVAYALVLECQFLVLLRGLEVRLGIAAWEYLILLLQIL
jgi:hypothetical protein